MSSLFVRSSLAGPILAAFGAAALGQGPAPIVPDGFQPPGPYPTTVCGASINIRNVAVPQEPDQGGEDDMFFEVPGSGPFFWTSSRNNGGDFGLNVSPFFGPGDPQSYPPQPADNFSATQDGTTYAWRLSYATGVSFATPRGNGTAGRFTYNGTPITLYYSASVGNQSSANGYSMTTGLHTAVGGAQQFGVDLLLGCAGIPDRQEAVGNVAVAYFPFEQGWVGGHWDNSFGTWQDGASSPELPTDVVTLQIDNSFDVLLPDVNSATDGMLLVNSSQTESAMNIIGAYPNNGGWTVFMRADDDIDLTGVTPPPGLRLNFSLLFVPYNSVRLIGGQINGTNGATIHGAGTYALTRLSAGRYGLTIPGKNDLSGGLVVTGCGLMAGSDNLPDRTFFSYEYDSANSRFIIESRELIPDNNTPWNRTPTLRDSDFYFCWIDYANPLAPPVACPGDLDGNNQVDINDLTQLLSHFGLQSGATPEDGDLDNDGDVDLNDLTAILSNFGTVCS